MLRIDVCKEAEAIKKALEPFGWSYIGGGPYPFRPKLFFKHPKSKNAYVVEIRPKLEDAK